MNAKETLEKIAEALGVTAKNESTEAPVEETTEAVSEEPQVEEVVETEAPVTTEESVEEKVEEPVEEVAEEAPVKSEREQALEDQINALKELLANVIDTDQSKEEEKAVEAPVAPVQPVNETKPLTHSPEAETTTKYTKIGNKGGSIMANVYKYMQR